MLDDFRHTADGGGKGLRFFRGKKDGRASHVEVACVCEFMFVCVSVCVWVGRGGGGGKGGRGGI